MRRFSRVAILIILVLCLAVVILTACDDTTISSTNTGSDVVNVYIDSFPDSAKNVYFGSELDLTGATLLTELKSGRSVSVNITPEMISGYNKKQQGEQTITITYAGFTLNTVVNVMELYIENIEITSKPADLSVVRGSELNLKDVVLGINYQNGSTMTMSNITDNMVSGYSLDLAPGEHTIYIEYAGHMAPLKINVVEKTVIGVSVSVAPKRDRYFVGEELDPSGLRIKRSFDNNTSDVLVYSPDDTDFEFDYDFSKAVGSALVTIRYRSSMTSFRVKVEEPSCSRMEITKRPVPVGIHMDSTVQTDLTSMIEGDKIDWETGEATIYYNDGSLITENLGSTSFYAFVDYEGADGYVSDKAAYKFDEVGIHRVTLRYGNSNVSASFNVTVVARTPYRMILSDLSQPADSTLEDGSVTLLGENVEGSRFKVDFLRYNVLYDNGTYMYNPVEDRSGWGYISADMLPDDGSTFTLSAALTDDDGYQTVNFAKDGVKNGFRIKVLPRVAVEIVVNPPYRNCFVLGSELDLTGAYLYVTYNDRKSRVEYFTLEDITLYIGSVDEDNIVYRLSQTGKYIAVINFDRYDGDPKSFEFTVVRGDDADTVTNVYFATLEAGEVYLFENYSDIFDSGLILKVENGDGSVDDIELTSANSEIEVLVADPEKTNENQQILFRYHGFVFGLQVKLLGRYITSIEVEHAPYKQVYKLGTDTELDLSGLVLSTLYSDGRYGQENDPNPRYWSFTGYDLSVAGRQTVNVCYTLDGRNVWTEFQIIVSASDMVSLTFDENVSNGTVSNFEGLTNLKPITGEDKYALFVTYRDDINTTYNYETIEEGLAVNKIETLLFAVRFADGSVEYLPLAASNVGYSKNTIVAGSDNYLQVAEISFNGFSASINLYVVKRRLVSISVYKYPDKLIYAEGQRLMVDGGYIERTFIDNNSEYSKDILPMTSGLISFNGYSEHPFANVQGLRDREQVVEVAYGGVTTGFTVTSYRKLETEPTVTGRTRQYGQTVNPVVTFAMEVEGFEAPETQIEYLVGGEWTTVTPHFPGSYLMRVTVIGNEYYVDKVWQDQDKYVYTVTQATLIINLQTKTKYYGDKDPELTYVIDESDLVDGDVVEIILSRVEGEDVGSYAIIAVLKAEGQNQNALYKLFATSASLIINAKTVGLDRFDRPIDATFTMPVEFDSSSANIPYSGSAIRAITASYSDGISNYIIDERDIEYYRFTEGEWKRMESLPREIGTYKVKISSNYEFAEGARSEREFTIS